MRVTAVYANGTWELKLYLWSEASAIEIKASNLTEGVERLQGILAEAAKQMTNNGGAP